MEAEDIIEILAVLRNPGGVRPIFMGGWGVDALLTRQTRRHDDLDLIVLGYDGKRATDALAWIGFKPVHRPDASPTNFAVCDDIGRMVDLHVAEDGMYGGVSVWAEQRRGNVAGVPVICLSRSAQITLHKVYPMRLKDELDMDLLNK